MDKENILQMGLRPLSESHKSLISALVQQGFKPPPAWPNDAAEARRWLYKMLRIVDVPDDEELWMIEQASYSPPLTQNHIPAVPHIQRKPGYMLLRQFTSMRQRQRSLLNRLLGRSNHNSR